MGCIPVSNSLNKSEEIAELINFLLSEDRLNLPRLPLPKILLTKFKPGLDSDIISNSIISRFNEIGIPIGPLEGSIPNVMENYTKVLMEEIVNAIQSDMRVDVAIDPGLLLQATGANAGGPVASVGSTTAIGSGSGDAK